MIQKIVQWFRGRSRIDNNPRAQEVFTREQVRTLIDEARSIGYSDGKRDGLAIARQQATNSLKEILRQQNRQS